MAATGSFSGNPARVQTFGYDANARLTSERNYKGAQIAAFLGDPAAPATEATSYTYDNVGNRTAKAVTTPAGTDSTNYNYDNNDRLTSETLTTATGSTVTTAYTWDGNDNLASKSSPSEYTGYVFDADNRLIEVRRGATQATAAAVASYGYDGDGQRIRKTTAGASTRYLIDPTTEWPQVALESAGTQATAYVWGDTLRQQVTGPAGSAVSTPAGNLIPLQGHLNTTLAAIDAAGAVVETTEATAYGELANTSPRLRHQYTGEYWQAEAGLTYLRARWYRPGAGSFMSVDPAWGRPTDPQTLNRYVYAESDPVQISDPSGAIGVGGDTGAALSVQGTLNSIAVPNVGRQFAGSAANSAGRAFENQIFNAIKSCLKPGANIRKITKADDFRDAAGRLAMPDFLLSIGGKFKVLELKTKLPTSKISEALERAAKQLDAALQAKYPTAILSKTKHRDSTFAKRKDDIEALLGQNAGLATYLNGTFAVMSFIAEFVVEECVENALGF
jgi:RHS repeat-associated protein